MTSPSRLCVRQRTTPTKMVRMHEIEITTDTIRLGQFLKLANLVDSGSDAKFLLAEGEITVNGEVEIRRGRQLRAGDVVEFEGIAARVIAG